MIYTENRRTVQRVSTNESSGGEKSFPGRALAENISCSTGAVGAAHQRASVLKAKVGETRCGSSSVSWPNATSSFHLDRRDHFDRVYGRGGHGLPRSRRTCSTTMVPAAARHHRRVVNSWNSGALHPGRPLALAARARSGRLSAKFEGARERGSVSGGGRTRRDAAATNSAGNRAAAPRAPRLCGFLLARARRRKVVSSALRRCFVHRRDLFDRGPRTRLRWPSTAC
jgi:hypothetical protein